MKNRVKNKTTLMIIAGLLLNFLAITGCNSEIDRIANFTIAHNVLYYNLIDNGTAYKVYIDRDVVRVLEEQNLIVIKIAIPAAYNGLPVTAIASGSFENLETLTSITIPDSVTSIGDYAFSGCTSLTNIIIPDNVIYIGDGAFYGCTSLTNITIGNSVTNIYYQAFEGCTSLTNITIPNSVTSIGYGAFAGCTNLKNINIPDSITSIDSRAFEDCTNLSITLHYNPNLLLSYWDHLDYKKYITSVIISNDITSIYYEAFYNCINLTSITIPDSVTSIGSNAFYNTGIWNSTSNNNIVYADKWAVGFKGTISSSLSLREDIIGISDEAFYNCNSLTDVTIGNNITIIGYEAFSNCSGLSNITLGNKVAVIGNRAFDFCNNTMNATILATVPPILEGSLFYYTPSNLRIEVPLASTDIYKSATGWNTYRDYIFAIGLP